MKRKDLQVGSAYCWYEYGNRKRPVRVVVQEVAIHTRRVHTAARWDFGGHTSTTWMVRVTADVKIPNDGWLMPGQIAHVWVQPLPTPEPPVDADWDSPRLQRLAQYTLAIWSGQNLGDYLDMLTNDPDSYVVPCMCAGLGCDACNGTGQVPAAAPDPDEWTQAERLEPYVTEAVARFAADHPEVLS